MKKRFLLIIMASVLIFSAFSEEPTSQTDFSNSSHSSILKNNDSLSAKQNSFLEIESINFINNSDEVKLVVNFNKTIYPLSLSVQNIFLDGFSLDSNCKIKFNRKGNSAVIKISENMKNYLLNSDKNAFKIEINGVQALNENFTKKNFAQTIFIN